MIKTGTLLQDRYLIEQQIGTGGMGRVYLAVDRRFESYVAIKETFYKDEELCEAFEREARLLNGLHHPVLPHVSDYFTEGNEHFLVMQFIEGQDLYEILKREGAFPAPDVLRWSEQLLDALDYLHSQETPITHRDIKPQNLKITQRGDIILLDFGLAKLNSDDTTAAVSVFGYSRAYSPLEQIQGTGTDACSDIFALGATVFHLMTGKPPVDVLTRAAAIIAGKPDPLQSADELNGKIPITIAQVLQTALSLNPAERFVSAKAMQQALEYAMSRDSVVDKENPTEPISAVAQIENAAQHSNEIKDFPALEAFVSDVANASAQTSDIVEADSDTIQIPNSDEQISYPAKASLQTTVADDNLTRIRYANMSWLVIGVLAAILISGSLAIWQYIGKSNASGESIPASVVKSVTETKPTSEQPAIDSPTPEISESILEDTKQVESETNVSVKNTGDDKTRRKSRQSFTTADSLSKKETVSIPAQAANSGKSQNHAGRPRIIVEQEQQRRQAPLPDIEVIFTGQSRQERMEQQRRRAQQEMRRRERREQRRREREQIGDYEWEQRPRRQWEKRLSQLD